MSHYIITGGAGFIGSNLIQRIFSIEKDAHIICIDNFDPFYDEAIKRLNISPFLNNDHFTLLDIDIANVTAEDLSNKIPVKVDAIIHLAAKAGVRPSILNPEAYQKTNVIGLQHMLDVAKIKNIQQFIFASSSSVYGINHNFPWKEDEPLLPISPYAMTKLAGEMAGHVYHQLYGIRFIALRFFTVYGPGQRPDLAIHKFTKNIIEGKPIPMYGDGSTSRDYTFVDDITAGIINAIHYHQSGFEIMNLGNHYTITLLELIQGLENILGKKAIINQLPEQAGDLPKTFADISKAESILDYHPQTQLQQGLQQFVHWFQKNENLLAGKK